MTLEYLAAGIIKGLSSDTKPTNVPANLMFVETDTRKIFIHAGAGVWNAIQTDPTDPIQPYTNWIVYKTGSTYKAKNGTTGLTPYSGTNLKTDIWDNIKANPAAYNHIHFLNADTPYDVPSGQTLDLDVTNTNFLMSGESMFGVRIRPLGNNIVLAATNGRKQIFENFTIYVDQGPAYTTDAFRLVASHNGVEHITVRGIKLRQDAGTSTITNSTGRGLVMVATGTGANFNSNDFSYCTIQGFLNAIALTSTAITRPPIAWANEQHFHRVNSQHSRYYLRAALTDSTDQLWGWHFKDCAWQTTNVDSTTEHMFDVDMGGTNLSRTWGWEIDNCNMWDPPANSKYLMANTQCRIQIKSGGVAPPSGSSQLGDQYMGGPGFNAGTGTWNSGAYVTREEPLAVRNGVATIGDGGTIAHGIPTTPKLVWVQPSVANEFASVTAIGSTNFTVAIKKHDSSAGTSQAVYWLAREYV